MTEKKEPEVHLVTVKIGVPLEALATVHATAQAAIEIVRYEEQLLEEARELIKRDKFSIAVVVAHMASEVAAERAISSALMQKDLVYLEDAIFGFLPGFSLANKRVRDLYNALTGRQMQNEPFWQSFKESAERRNKAVHKGLSLTKEEAEISVKAAFDLIYYLK